MMVVHLLPYLFGIFVIFYLLNKAIKKLIYSPKIQLLGKFVTHVQTTKKVVALTYDDGPNPPDTDRLLAVLARLQVKATFFVLGRQVEQYPETAKIILSQGHELGNHSYSHPKMLWKSPKFIRSEIQKTDRLLREVGVTGNIHFRPPYGLKFVVLPYVLMQLGKVTISWDVDSEDYQKLDSQAIVDNVLDLVKPGSIILLHDSLDNLGGDRSKTITATEILIEKLLINGYQFKTISELLALQD
jgi:peptidoglycan-N-acetylglucosamine deacetylase